MLRPGQLFLRNLLFAFAILAGSLLQAQITWRRSYGGFDSDRAACVRQTQDGGYIVAGSTGSFGQGSGDIYTIRLNELGDPLWSRTYGGLGVDIGVSCRALTDGFIIGGTTTTGEHGGYDMVLIRTDLNGDVLWQRSYGTDSWDLCNAMEALPDGFIMAGISYGGDSPIGASYVVRTDLLGDTVWTWKYSSIRPSVCNGISSCADGGFLLAGSVETVDGPTDGTVTKITSAGEGSWISYFGGDSADHLISVVEGPSGDIVACGDTHSQNPYMQVYLVGMGPDGAMQWEQFIGSIADAAGTEIRARLNGGYVFTGYNTLNLGNRDIILTTVDEFGQFLTGNNFGNGEPADGYSLDPTADGGYVVAGWCENYGPGIRSVYVVKADGDCQTEDLEVVPYYDPQGVSESTGANSIFLFPNPLQENEVLQIRSPLTAPVSVTISDVTGTIVTRSMLEVQEGLITLPDLAAGLYLLELSNSSGLVRGIRLVVE